MNSAAPIARPENGLLSGQPSTVAVIPSVVGARPISVKISGSLVSTFNISGLLTKPCVDLFCVNAACALRVSGVEEDLQKGTEIARETIGNGTALEKLRQLIRFQGGQYGEEKLAALLLEC